MESRISGHTKLFCLIGSPVGHSGSPAMYNYTFERLGIDAAYLAFDIPLEQVEAGVEALKTLGVGGFNVTMPDKTAVSHLVDELSPAAKLIGACNTVTVDETGKLTGHNTDGVGFVRNLHEHGVEVKGKKLVVMGAGGAATAICMQTALDGAAEIAIFNRDDEFYANGQHTVEKLAQAVPGCKASITPLEDSAALIERWHDPSYGSMRQIALAPCSPFSVSRELLLQSAKLARQYHVRLHTHLAETRDEEHYTLDRYGLRPLAYLESLGWVGPDVWFAHGIHFTDAELDLLAETGTGVAHCPVSNMKLSSGVAHIPEMLQRGIHVGLAVDGSASQDGSDLLEEIRICYLLHRLHSSAAAPSGYDVLKLATRGSASLLGREDIGCLAVGKCADLFLVDSRRLELVGACYDPKNVFGTVGLRAPVDYTVVNGCITVAHGKLTGIDEAKTAENARHVCDRYLGKN